MAEAFYRRPQAGLTTLNFLFAGIVILLLCAIGASTHASGQQAQRRAEERLIASQAALAVAEHWAQWAPGTYTDVLFPVPDPLRPLANHRVIVVVTPYSRKLRQITVTVAWTSSAAGLLTSRTITRLIPVEEPV